MSEQAGVDLEAVRELQAREAKAGRPGSASLQPEGRVPISEAGTLGQACLAVTVQIQSPIHSHQAYLQRASPEGGPARVYQRVQGCIKEPESAFRAFRAPPRPGACTTHIAFHRVVQLCEAG